MRCIVNINHSILGANLFEMAFVSQGRSNVGFQGTMETKGKKGLIHKKTHRDELRRR